MKKTVSLLVLSVCLLPLLGCGSSHEGVMKDMISITNDFADALESCKDKASAEAAVPKLESLLEDMQDLQKQGKALEEPDAETQKKLMEKYGKDLMMAAGRMGKARQAALGNPEVAAIIKPILDKFSSAMK